MRLSIFSKKFLSLVAITILVMTNVIAADGIQMVFHIQEEQPPNTYIGNINTSEAPPNYQVLNSNSDISINLLTGEFRTAVTLDREVTSSYTIGVMSMETFQVVEVTINVTDINDQNPFFPNGSISLPLPENFPNGSKLHIGSAVDKDVGLNGIANGNIISGNDDGLFKLETKKSGNTLFMDLKIDGHLDYETTPFYALVIRVFDGGSPPNHGDVHVNITVQDANDNTPRFSLTKYSTVVPEDKPVDSSIIQVSATDLDSGENGKIEYLIQVNQNHPEEHFYIDSKTGVIRIRKPLDYENKNHYQLTVYARDNGTQPLEASTVVEVNVSNVNELPANINLVFLYGGNQSSNIAENATIGTAVASISVSDPDKPNDFYVNVNVTLQGDLGYFGLKTQNMVTYVLYVKKKLDRELHPNFNLTLIAVDSGTPPLHTSKSFTMNILDVNDNAPVFTKSVYDAEIQEQAPAGLSVIIVTAIDQDIGENARITYSIINTPDTNSDWFQIDSRTGQIRTRGDSTIDCEHNSNPRIIVHAVDHGIPQLSSNATVNVVIRDVNDLEPVFERSYYEGRVNENAEIGFCFLTVSATDPDCSGNTQVSYRLENYTSHQTNMFKIGTNTGTLCIDKPLDYESRQSYEFTVFAEDSGNLDGSALIKVIVTDVNDNYPEFYPKNYSTNLDYADANSGKNIIVVQAKDLDSGTYSSIQYTISGGNEDGYFSIKVNTGLIYLASSLPSEEKVYVLQIQATDGGGLSSHQPATVYISVTGDNSHPPVFTKPTYKFSVGEGAVYGTTVGTVHATVQSSGSNPPAVRYSITYGDQYGFFMINQQTGVLSTTGVLDHDKFPFILLNIKAEAGNPPVFGNAQVNVTITDVNDNSPEFTSTSLQIYVWENEDLATTLYAAQAKDIDSGENGTVRYRLLQNPDNTFGIDPISGEIRLEKTLDYEKVSQYTVIINAYDQGTPISRSSNMTLVVVVSNVNDNAPIFTKSVYVVNVSESTDISTNIVQIQATDLDKDRVAYSFRDADYDDIFGIFGATGDIYLRQKLDRETKADYLFTVIAKDNGKPDALSASAQVNVRVTDTNDNVPVFSQQQYSFQITENMPSGTTVGRVLASDRDAENNAELRYGFQQSQNAFDINPYTGEITTRIELDRELQSEFNIAVEVTDRGNIPNRVSTNVKVTVNDQNDDVPKIMNKKPLEESVRENLAKGTPVVKIMAIDNDLNENGTISFQLTADGDPNVLNLFSIHPKTGLITTLEVLDFEKQKSFSLNVIAKDHGKPPLQTIERLVINVVDDNDEKPIFVAHNITIPVVENTKVGSVVGRVEAHDKDSGENGRISYYIVGGNVFKLFAVNVSNGDIYCIRDIDYEESSSHKLGIMAIDSSAYNPKSSSIIVEMQIIDVNDNPPLFDRDPIFLSRKENLPVGHIVYTFTATDADSGLNGTVEYSIENQTPDDQLFILNSKSGELKINKIIDYELVKQISLQVKATDMCPFPSEKQYSTVTMVVIVLDVNDNAPQFHGNTTYTVLESEPIGSPVIHVMASDIDGNVNNSGNGIMSYDIVSGNSAGNFVLDSATGLLSIAQKLDREVVASYNLKLRATDHGSPSQSAVRTYNIQVLDVNDNAPKFVKPTYQINITENSSPGDIVLVISATDPDIGVNGELTYSLPDGVADGLFELNHLTGQLITKGYLDRESKSSYILTASVKDSGHPVHYDMTTIIINVTDVNDNTPVFTQNDVILEVPENRAQPAIFRLVAKDEDTGENGRLTYAIVSGNVRNAFSLDPATGQLSCGKLDREDISSYNLTIRVVDHGSPQRSAYCVVTVKVIDENDNLPKFKQTQYSSTIIENVVLGTFVLQVSASDIDEGENAQITYSLGNDTDGMFQVDSVSGNITTNGLFDREKKSSYLFYVMAKDNGLNNIHNTTVPVRVNIQDYNDNPPVFEQIPYYKNLSLNLPKDTHVLRVQASDKDLGLNQEVRYNISMSGTDLRSQQYFYIDNVSGDIYTAKSLSTDAEGPHTLQIIATDLGIPPLTSIGIVEVNVGATGSAVSLRFQSRTYTTTMEEHSPSGTAVTTVTAEYVGSGSGSITYSFVNHNDVLTFTINDLTGAISVKEPSLLDYEVSPERRVIVEASSNSNLYAYTTVVITLLDINDHAPKFAQDFYYSSTWEEEGINVYVTQVQATDMDSQSNAKITYNIIEGNDDNSFAIEPSFSGIVVTKTYLDYEIKANYRLVIEAVDNGFNPQTGTCILRIDVVDINDQRPSFPQPSPVNISEASNVGSLVAQITANDVDKNPTLLYDFSPMGNPDNTFAIDHFNGKITLAKPLDHEKRRHYSLGLVVNDTHFKDTTVLDVYIEDKNDNAPIFSQQSYQKTILELTPPDTHVLTVNATDADDGINAAITYRLGVTPLSNDFRINPITGGIYTNRTISYRPEQQIITLIVTAEDAGSPRLSAVVAIHLQVLPVNQHAPVFMKTNYTVYIPEDGKVGMNVERITASDQDQNQEIDYSIMSGNTGNLFQINRRSGQIFLKGSLDREVKDRYSLQIRAQDNGVPVKNSTTLVTIVIQDVNDKSPYFNPSEYSINLTETYQSDVPFLKVHASDKDTGVNAEILYAITSGNDQGLFIVNGITGDVLITPNSSLDFEQNEVHKLIVRAIDCRPCSSSQLRHSAFATVTVNVLDVNEYKPVFPVPFFYASVAENKKNDTRVFQVHANDKDGGKYGEVTYSLSNMEVFRIDPTTGWVYTKMVLDYENLPFLPDGTFSYRFQVMASDTEGKSNTALVVIQIVDEDDYDPVFLKTKYSFSIRGDAKPGVIVGQVNASDDDKGLAGKVYYTFKHSNDYFGINLTSGEIFVKRSFSDNVNRRKRNVQSSRHKRALTSDSVVLVIEASTGATDSRSTTTVVDIEIDRSCEGCLITTAAQQTAFSETAMILVIVFVILAVALIVVIVVIVVRYRNRKVPPPVAQIYEPEYQGQFGFPLPPDNEAPPMYNENYNNSVNVTTPDVSEQSHHSASSGRGSVEAEEDEEICMINSNSSQLNQSSGFRSKNMPDSGIQDDDNTSEPSVQNSKDYLARLGIGIDSSNNPIKSKTIMQSVESMHQFSDEGGGEGIGVDNIDFGNRVNSNGDVIMYDRNKDMGFHEPEPQHAGSLSNVINNEEEYSGSYNWDYLLDWGPQYQPLAHVFTEIARLKDDNLQPKKQPVKTVPQRKLTVNLNPQVKMDPPPIITNAPPRTVQAINNRSSHSSNSARTSSTMNISSLPSLPRSPISHESSFTSPALTPSFTPSLSPLATRSPSISPMIQGNSGHNTPNRQRLGSNGHMIPMTISSESEQELRI